MDSLNLVPFKVGFDFCQGNRRNGLDPGNMVIIGLGESCTWPKTRIKAIVTDGISVV